MTGPRLPLRARAAHLGPKMTLEAWGPPAQVTYERSVLDDLVPLRFVEASQNAFVLGPPLVGKTFIATAVGHIACRTRVRAHFKRADRLFRRLKATRLDGTCEAEVRKLIGTDLLIIDDFVLQRLGPIESSDFYELVVERHKAASTVLTSNREPKLMWNGPVKSGSAELAELLFGAFEREGLGFFQN